MVTGHQGVGLTFSALTTLRSVGAVRFFTIDGEEWRAEEMSNEMAGTRSVVFSSRGVVRRIRNYPTDWRTLSDAELYTLSWGR